MRKNPFLSIYHEVNNGTNKEKYDKILEQKGEAILIYLDIELTNLCNFNCAFCATGTNALNRTKGFMADEVVEAIVNNILKYDIKELDLLDGVNQHYILNF